MADPTPITPDVTGLLGELAKQGLLGVVAAMGWLVAWQKDKQVQAKDVELKEAGQRLYRMNRAQSKANERMENTISAMKDAVAQRLPPGKP